MDNRKKNRLNRLRITSLALASITFMGNGVGHAKAIISDDGSSIKKEPQSSPTVNNDSEITPEEQQKINESKITDEWDSFSFQDLVNGNNIFEVYKYTVDGVNQTALICGPVSEINDKKEERVCREIFSEEPIFIRKNGENIIIGIGILEGKNLGFIANYGLEQYFEEVEKRSISIDEIETMGDLRKIVLETPSLIDDYVDMSKLQLKDNNETRLVYCPDGYMKLEEDSLKTYVKIRRS